MQLVNYSKELFDVTGSTHKVSGKTERPWLVSNLLPVGLLVTAIAASLLLGNHVKSRDELDWLTQLANQGDSGAQLQLGLAYRDGRYGLVPDAKTGLYWLQRSAAGGSAYAEDAIGMAYAKGEGTKQDNGAAEQWWQKAINHGDREARIHLADALIQAGRTDEGNALLN
jgi:TPR repeat protein